MSLNLIREYITFLRALRKAINRKDAEKANHWLSELKTRSDEIANADIWGPSGKPNFRSYNWKLSKALLQAADTIESSLSNNPERAIKIIDTWIRYLKGIKDQQKRYKEIMKDVVRPFLKKNGLKRRAENRFYLPPEGKNERQIHIQKHRFNDYDTVKFTMNIGKGREVEVSRGVKRISSLLGVTDHWYEISPYTNLPRLAAKLEHDLAVAIEYLKGLPPD